MATKKKKTAPAPVKHQLTTGDIEALVGRWKELEEEMAPLAEELKGIKDALVDGLDVKDAFTFGNFTLRIMQGQTRTGLNWKKIAGGLAKALYGKGMREWLVGIAKRYPKCPTKPYARLFEFKPQTVGATNGKD